MSQNGYFVTGTGTEVGKTVVAAALARTLFRRGERVAVLKPVESGMQEEGLADHDLLRIAAGSAQTDDEIAPFRFGPPVSPHLAAELAGKRIEPDALLRAAGYAARGADCLVCEGAGGLLVPLVGAYLIRDLAAALGLPLVVAAGPGLGTINHTLLTLEAARSAGLRVACVVLTPWPEEPGDIELSNRSAIAELGRVPVLTLAGLDVRCPGSWPSLEVPQFPRIAAAGGARLAA